MDEVEEAIQRLARSQDDHKLSAGTVVAGRFEVLRLLGEGAMGAVYLAIQKSMDRQVALKTLQHHSMKNEELLRRFYLEAKAASKLDHPNIVRIFDFGIDEELELPFIAMEYLTGDDLGDVLKERGPLAERDACHLLSQVAKALVDAHDKGIVHRDLKPDNIHVRRLTDGDQQCKVLDFGIAKMVQGGSESMANLTGTGMTMGTPLYMSPEQIQGSRVDFRSDLYSLGCILFELLTDRRPYDGEDRLGVLLKHLNEPIPDLPGALVDGAPPTDALRQTVKCLMAKAFQERPGSTSAVARVLEALGKGEGVDVAGMLTPDNASPNAPAVEPEVLSTAQAAVIGEAATMAAPSISEDAKVTELGVGPDAAPASTEPTKTEVSAAPDPGSGSRPAVWVVLGMLLVAGGLGWAATRGGDVEESKQVEGTTAAAEVGAAQAPTTPTLEKSPAVAVAPDKGAAAPAKAAPDEPASGKAAPDKPAVAKATTTTKPPAKPAPAAAKGKKPPRGPTVGGYKVRTGKLTTSDVKNRLSRSSGNLRACFKQGKLTVPVLVRMVVKGDGSVGSVSVKPESAKGFKACITPALRSLSFPATPEVGFNTVEVTVRP